MAPQWSIEVKVLINVVNVRALWLCGPGQVAFLEGKISWLVDMIGWALGKFLEMVTSFTMSAGNVGMFVAVHIEYELDCMIKT